MSLFTEPITMTLTPAERDLVMLPIEGDGGHQRLLRVIQALLKGHDLTLEDDTLEKVARYAYSYGGGGYQQRFKAVLAAARRAGWARA